MVYDILYDLAAVIVDWEKMKAISRELRHHSLQLNGFLMISLEGCCLRFPHLGTFA